MQQVVYVDVLVMMNTIVTFVLLLTVRQFAEIRTSPVRLTVASLVGGFYSLVLLAPQMSFWLTVLTKLLMGISIVMIAFRTRVFRKMLRCILLFSGVSFLYAGAIYAFALTVDFRTVQIRNGFAYYDLGYSAVIFLCLILYMILSLIKKRLFVFSHKDMLYKMEIKCGDRSSVLTALLDTGNHLRDPYSGKPVILVNPSVGQDLTGVENAGEITEWTNKEKPVTGFRLLPVSVLNASGVLPACTVDLAVLQTDRGEKTIEKPCVAFTGDTLGADRYQALINEAVFM